jgi:hypothetical protein
MTVLENNLVAARLHRPITVWRPPGTPAAADR